tara:strand:+ start:533 stop:832 length:300 start_codon:yes stop_codon:yes gene_type:complete
MGKVLFNILILIFLSGCFQSTSMIGPGITLVSTGNIPHAFGTFLTNSAVKNETGMHTHQLIAKKVEEQKIKNDRKKIPQDLVILIENNIKKTRNIIISD